MAWNEQRLKGLLPNGYRHHLVNKGKELTKDVMNCVYFITDGEYTKIGIATSLKRRLSGLQTSNPRKLTVVCTIPNSDKHKMQCYEAKLHKYFEKKNMNGEWFDLIESDIKDAEKMMGFEFCLVE